MSDYASKYPLLALMDILQGWVEGVRHWDFWREGNNVDYVNYVEEIRSEAKELIVWMELKGFEEQAIRLEFEMQAFRQAVWDFKHESNVSFYPPEDDYCNELRDEMADQADIVAGCLECIQPFC